MLFKKEVNIHKKIFPLATPEDQLMHLCEELKEMDEADDNFLDEWADALFVAISLQRFEHTKYLAEIMLNVLYFNYSIETQLVLDEHLAKAIKKVKSRKYYFINNHYEREKNV
jgi:hypothetical protein